MICFINSILYTYIRLQAVWRKRLRIFNDLFMFVIKDIQIYFSLIKVQCCMNTRLWILFIMKKMYVFRLNFYDNYISLATGQCSQLSIILRVEYFKSLQFLQYLIEGNEMFYKPISFWSNSLFKCSYTYNLRHFANKLKINTYTWGSAYTFGFQHVWYVVRKL